MTNTLMILYNTLKLIETKGDSTKVMADCLKYLEQMIEEQKKADEEAKSEPASEENQEA